MKKIVSNRFEFIPEDLKKIALGAAMASIGAFVTFFLDNIKGVDFGTYTPFIVAIVSILANSIRKWISKETYVK